MPRVTLRERLFPLHASADVDRILEQYDWCAIFKAGTSDKTFDAWQVAQDALEPRCDVAMGLIRLPDDRAASERVAARSNIVHRSPQLVLFNRTAAAFHLDELAITPYQLAPLLTSHLPAKVGPRVWNEAVITLEPYRALLSKYLDGRLSEERFEWAYLDLLRLDAVWRDDETFDLLNGLFENPAGRDFRAASLIALEFQGQLSGRHEPLKIRAARMIARLAGVESVS